MSRRVWVDKKGRRVFVSDSYSDGRLYCAVVEVSDKLLKKLNARWNRLVASPYAAQEWLDAHAMNRGWKLEEESE